ncbi:MULTISPECIES: VanZ family protein [unclassified Bacillus (in: firmicutes)]|uniref:VanZ family protein n=1 Tax=unclassified Bacillus (in: firmicutes) TaxID=185979 RepID=UPI001BEBE4DE|nr:MULTISPECIES: VanZ family protein [unclassified Bacillus (in: firmicutes)]MBT2617599.1 VanZ family protein [Bacillus sp. ISL-78]MBT2631658.1 VanZ family protein [Bacillus sp. ISL-101]MBT2715891.1 VanZ family protein [Bacillus sp. ISL-57]
MSLKSVMLSLLLSQALFLCGLPLFLQLLLYLNPLVIMVVWFCILLFVSFAVLYFRGETVRVPRLLWQAVLFGYSLSLMVLLFFRPEGQVYSYNLIPFSTILSYLSNETNGFVSFYNLSANVGLFIPFGLYLLSREGQELSAKRKFIYPLLSISGIEICQFVFRRGSLDVDDLTLNMIGVYIGYLLYPLFKKVVVLSGKVKG